MLIDGFNEQTGLGFSFLSLHAIFLQALHENRTLLPTSAVSRGHEWRWCAHGPRDYNCYFEPWSPCEQHLGLSTELHGGASATKWDLASLGQATLSEPIVHLDLREDWKQDTIHLL